MTSEPVGNWEKFLILLEGLVESGYSKEALLLAKMGKVYTAYILGEEISGRDVVSLGFSSMEKTRRFLAGFSPYGRVTGIFEWDKSPQGHTFWFNLDTTLHEAGFYKRYGLTYEEGTADD